jgi:hypothetical protein
MSFLKDNEYLILMDINAFLDGNPGQDWHKNKEIRIPWVYSEDDFKRLRDAGIQTVTPFHMHWEEIETEPGVFNWDIYDNYIEIAERAGLKVMIQTASHYPQWFPDDWYIKTVTGIEKVALSPWCDEAMDRNLDFNQRLIDRYASTNRLVYSVQLRCGETVLLNEAAFYDDHALAAFKQYAGSDMTPVPGEPFTEGWLRASYIKMIVDQQRVLATQQHREIWMMLHPVIADFGYYGNGNNWIYEILLSLKLALSPIKISHIFYTWAQWPTYWEKMRYLRDAFDEDQFGGAEYTEGLKITTPAAIEQGLRGHILAPCYPGVHDKLEDWMLDNIRTAQAQWEASRA